VHAVCVKAFIKASEAISLKKTDRLPWLDNKNKKLSFAITIATATKSQPKTSKSLCVNPAGGKIKNRRKLKVYTCVLALIKDPVLSTGAGNSCIV